MLSQAELETEGSGLATPNHWFASHPTYVGCNNGGGGGNFSKVKRFLPSGLEHRNGYSLVLLLTGGILETQELFPKAYFTHNPYMHICPCSWAHGIYKNIGIRTYFASMTAESVGGFRPSGFCVMYKSRGT